MNKILIIEDDEPTRRTAAQILRFEGFEVVEADNGRTGIARARETTPDLIVCDIMMPDLDGFGVLQALREESRTVLTPFIFLTAMASPHDLRHGMEEGADDYITKPYNPDSLLGSVRRRLEKRARQIADSERRSEELSLAVAASLPAEILEPLDHILTVADLMAIKFGAQEPEVAAMHESITCEALRLRRVTRRLHLYAQLPQLYANRFELEKSGQCTSTKDVLPLLSREIGRRWKREDDLLIECEDTDVPMAADYFGLILEELVDNACKFSPPGAAIQVRGERREAFWSLAVASGGAGLSPAQINQIGAFKQFWTGLKKPRGLGLGLALVQGLARCHSCEFTIESKADETTAALLVPLES